MESGRFPPSMVGEDGSYFEKGDLFFFLCNRFPDWAAVRVPSYFVGGGETSSWEIYIMKKRFGSFFFGEKLSII